MRCSDSCSAHDLHCHRVVYILPLPVQQELESVQSQVEAVRQKVADATARCRAARGLRNTLSNRVTSANNALVAVLQGNSQLTTADAAAPSVPDPPVTDAAPMASGGPGAQSTSQAHSLLPQSSARSYFFSQERPLSSFTHSAVLSPEECERLGCMLPGVDGCINLRDSVQAYKSAVAQQVSVPCGDICWFLQTPYMMHTGRHLSFSSSLSSDQCCASFFLFFMATSLENTLAGAELDRFNGTLEDGVMLEPACQHAYGAQLIALSYTAGLPFAGEAMLMHDPLLHSSAAAPLDVGPSLSSAVCRKRSRGPARETFSSSLMQQPLLDPSAHVRLVRCGVSESCDVTSALSAMIGGMLRDSRSHMPRAQWLKCCQLFLQFVDQVAGRGEGAEQGLPEYCEQQLPEYSGQGGSCGTPIDATSFGMQVAIMLQTLCNVTASVMQEDVPEVCMRHQPGCMLTHTRAHGHLGHTIREGPGLVAALELRCARTAVGVSS